MKNLLFILMTAIATSAFAGDFQVVVHASNPVTTIKKPLLRDYFLGRATRWIDGSAVKPFDLAESSQVRAEFSAQILGKDTAAVKNHWLTMTFSGRGTPPPQFETEEKLLAAIRATPTAIGYISANTSLGTGLKSIVVTDK